ncbi:hypothetical protein AVEN_127143-1, partial [Araneus ventricosus]
MAYLGTGRKHDLINLATELGLQVTEGLKVVELKQLITSAESYDEEFTKNLFKSIIDERMAVAAEKEAERLAVAAEKEAERQFELEKSRIEAGVSRNMTHANSSQEVTDQAKFDLSRILPKFNPKEDEIGLYLTMFERQLKFVNIPETNWIPYLIGSLPSEINQMIVKENEEDSKDYAKVKEMLLKRYRLTADRFRQLFVQHRKSAEITWKDYTFELKSYFEGWTTELNISTFEELKELIIADQIKRRTPPEFKEHFVDYWSELNKPFELAEKLDAYETVKLGMKKHVSAIVKKPFFKENVAFHPERKCKTSHPREVNQPRSNDFDKSVSSRPERKSSIRCYGCGYPGFIQSKCPKCTKPKEELKTVVQSIKLYAAESPDSPSSSICLTVCGRDAA